MRRRAKKRLLILLALLAVLGGGGYVFFSPTFFLSEINIAGNSRICDEEISRVLPFAEGDHILFLQKGSARKALIADDRIAKCEIHRRYPNQVDIVIEEMTPVLLLSSGKIWGVSERGTALPIKSAYEIPNLPFLSLSGTDPSPEAYRTIESSDLNRGLEFWAEIQEKYPQFLDAVSEIIVNGDDGISLILSGTGTLAHLGDGDYARRVLRLRAITSEIEKSGKKANYIDLRYTDQAIVRLDKRAQNQRPG